MISDRYLLRAVFWPGIAVTAALVAIFASYSVTRYLADAAQGQAAMQVVAQMIGLRVLIALEVLLPLGLYLGLIIGLGRLYSENEMTAWQAGGLSRGRMLAPLLAFAMAVAVVVGLLSLFGRPWAYAHLYTLEVTTQTRLNLATITARRFYASDDAVIYAGAKSDHGQQLDRVFARLGNDDGGDPGNDPGNDDRPVLIRAAHMRRSTDADGASTLDFENGNLYQLDMQGEEDRVLAFDRLQWHLPAPSRVVGYKRKAASSRALMAATDPDEIAERQWRFSRPAAVVFLALLGIAFARSAPRRSQAGNAVAAAVSFGLYYGLASIARSWVEQGAVAWIPGVYWVDALVAVLACGLLFWRKHSHY